ncbi:hypothetical protein SAMN00017405_0099 [Desulfonispora thiosulfatigenes DSM 11270]|uniref:tRNA (guanine-N(1)-)-methyltransferase C-terminal domain-containing protein n=1 Tax=Desulfonispora thiosulfatigenes DSM 11270 TaxID=656914 RepID=A0A1W1VKK4_DESTI|nr:RNA methyltransferase [Desulfonispora thiosulfatigenes]SMB93823.1 hypothetical protein SAMN00017405_0099 [Desulfonispora thiosulfatigenes DSM 11270]
MGRLFLGLVHYPVHNKNKEVIVTSITNLDIHDIARTCKTFNFEKYYIIHPLENQQKITKEIIDYWQTGYGGEYNPDRKMALENVTLTESIESAKAEILNKYPGELKVIVTDAKIYHNSINYKDLRNEIESTDINYLILFGTGWGITAEEMEKADFCLTPIYGVGEYNHLSVRSAVAIIIDRLCGEKWW